MAYKDKLPILKNFVEMGITQDVSSVDTTIYVSNASLFPSVVPGADYIPCVIRWSGSTREVVHVTAVNTSANTITVERGQEGTAAQSWPIGSFIYATLTAQAQADLLNNIWIRCRQSDGNAVAITVESATSFSLPGDWTDSLEPMMALRILANDAFLATENGIYIDSVSYTASTGKTLVGIRGVTLPATIAAVEHSLSSRAVSQSKEVQAYRDLVERVSANLNKSERICIEKAQIAQAAVMSLMLPGVVVPFYRVNLGGPEKRNPIFWGETEPDTGWLICDGGSDGRGGSVPDLRNRFVMCSSYSGDAGQTGGADSATPTISVQNTVQGGSIGDTKAGGTVSNSATGVSVQATTLDGNTLPAHSHQLNAAQVCESGGGRFCVDAGSGGLIGYSWVSTVGNSWGHTHGITDPGHYHGFVGVAHTHTFTGAAHTHAATANTINTLPPYYKMAYCVKLPE
ncbi:hypothetical protein LJE06_03615 [Bilophila wadsworthia]|uniref:hypothetical protein n=1 Tax=Bilophila wadsworthia TaxID=35833 RepID=UPI001D0AD753|nr:hypothetical protein [Bilophila wadsworthia]MCB8570193.1 hypothetical protein [Bilophila wadsworthia]MCC2714212.1 hypothetical protein [Bilophila wadsworthia]